MAGYTKVTVQVTDQTLQITNEPTLTSGGVKEIQVSFTFCSLWSDTVKTAVFYRNEDDVYHQLLEDNACLVPQEVATDEGIVYFGVFGIDSTGEQTRTSEVIALTFKKGAITTATKLPDPTPDIYAQIIKCVQLHPAFANTIEECTDTSRLYVLPDGYIYAYMYAESAPPEIAIESGNGYWNTENTWVSDTSMYCKYTDFIPVIEGEQFSYKGLGRYSVPSIIWFDENREALSFEQYDSRKNVTTVTVPSGVSYGRFVSYSQTSVDATVLDVSWVLCKTLIVGYQWASTGHAFIPADYEDRIANLEKKVDGLKFTTANSVLVGKKIVYDGDSICQGTTTGGGYAKLIAEAVGGVYDNQGVGGGRLTSRTDAGHSVVDNLGNLPIDGDIYCFEGGINDYWNNVTLGDFSLTDFTGNLDASTVCGALETIFRHALTNFVGKPICFVITHKIQNTAYSANANGDTFALYREKMIGICEKYSVPYYDAFTESGLNGWNAEQSQAFLTGNTEGTADGCHPNEEGYKRYYVPQMLSLFRRITPAE